MRHNLPKGGFSPNRTTRPPTLQEVLEAWKGFPPLGAEDAAAWCFLVGPGGAGVVERLAHNPGVQQALLRALVADQSWLQQFRDPEGTRLLLLAMIEHLQKGADHSWLQQSRDPEGTRLRLLAMIEELQQVVQQAAPDTTAPPPWGVPY